MEFNRLRASIANNADEAPSIYMAFCMIESLLDDIEDAAGQEIGDWPVGDDTLPTKMVWLCQMIRQIYKEKGGEFTRNRPRLDAAMKDLEKVSAELEAVSETAVRLSAVKTDLKQKQTVLERAKAEWEEYETIKERCRQLQSEADSLRVFDKAAQEAKLRALQAETADLAGVKSGLEAELAGLLEAQDEIVGKTAGLRVEIEQTQARLEQKNNALDRMEQQRLEAQKRESELTDRLRETTQALSALQDAVARLEAEKLPERKRQRDDEEARKKSLEQALASLELETGRLRGENLELSSKIAGAQEEFDTHNSVYARLTEDYRKKSEEIAALVLRLEELQGKNDTQKHEIYRRQRAEQIAELERMGEECAALERELTALDLDIKAKQREAEELRKKAAQSEEVRQKLSDVLCELKPIISEEFIKELNENRQRLETLETVRGNLSGTLSSIREILGKTPVADNGALLDNMRATLQWLFNSTDSLQRDLVQYTKTATWGEPK